MREPRRQALPDWEETARIATVDLKRNCAQSYFFLMNTNV
jgi:hypothetical protein